MSDRQRLHRLATVMYGIAIVMFGGIFIELLAAKHVQEPLQWVPLVFCVVGVAAVLLAWNRASLSVILALRLIMVGATAVTLLGVWKHAEGNLRFVRELHPNTSGLALVVGAVTGRAPLLTSGALAVTGAIAIVATFAAGGQAIDARDPAA